MRRTRQIVTAEQRRAVYPISLPYAAVQQTSATDLRVDLGVHDLTAAGSVCRVFAQCPTACIVHFTRNSTRCSAAYRPGFLSGHALQNQLHPLEFRCFGHRAFAVRVMQHRLHARHRKGSGDFSVERTRL